ncbi:MAG: hypothetical protein NVS3B3_12650 [Aquirhabdus sp.]
MSIALSMGVTLVGCGGGNSPTTRIDTSTPPSSTLRTSYNLTVQSPVLLSNVQVTVTDTATGVVLGQTTVQNGNEVVFAIPIAYLKAGNVILMTLSPVDSSSKYFDPMLNNQLGAMASFNQSLHGLISLSTNDKTTKVDPFSEIIYERTLIRAGILDISKPQFNALTSNQLTLATNEMATAFGTSATTTFSVKFNSPASIAAIHLYTTVAGVTSVDAQANNALLALGQLALYAQNNSTAQTPYLDFAKRASLDFLDGDLDGMTIFGGDAAGTVQITNPILYTGITSTPNNDPDHTDVNSLITVNSNQRKQHGVVLKQATIQYFNNINASLPVAARTDTASLNYMQNYDYGIFTPAFNSSGFGGTTPTEPSYRIGAGNYTRAFGLPTLPPPLPSEYIKKAIDASDASDRSNDIMQLNGTYQGNGGCQLNIGYDGTIQLSQGALSFTTIVNRKYSDSLRQYPVGSKQYILNATSADVTAPRFIQIRTVGAQVVSAEAGRSIDQFPITLDTTELSCTF